MDTRYKLAITIAYFALAVVALIVVALIVVFRPDATATIIQFVGTTMAIASTGAVTFYMLGKTADRIEQVAVQTNGTLSKKDEQIAELIAERARYHKLSDPSNFDETTGATITPGAHVAP